MHYIALFGAGGGIGQALVALYSAQPDTHVVAFSRSQSDIQPGDNVTHLHCDYSDESVLQAQLAQLDVRFSCVIIATGCLHRGEAVQPEKSLKQLSKDAFIALQLENAWLPIAIAQQLMPYMHRQSRAQMVCLSARVGSISDNHLGGWYSYRSSKASLNMLWRCLAQEKKLSHKKLILACVHPGTVATNLSEPFRKNAKRVFSPQESAEYIKNTIDKLQPQDSGGFFAWDGQRIPY